MSDDECDDNLNRVVVERQSPSIQTDIPVNNVFPSASVVNKNPSGAEFVNSLNVDHRSLIEEGMHSTSEAESQLSPIQSLKRKQAPNDAVSESMRSKKLKDSQQVPSDVDCDTSFRMGPDIGMDEPVMWPLTVPGPRDSPMPFQAEISSPPRSSVPQHFEHTESLEGHQPSVPETPHRPDLHQISRSLDEPISPIDSFSENTAGDMFEHLPQKQTDPQGVTMIEAETTRTSKVTAFKGGERADPPTSPIEDPSDISATTDVRFAPRQAKKAALQSGPSRLYLEVKERVAQHTTTRRRDDAKLGTKRSVDLQPSEMNASDDSSVIYVSSSSSAPSRCTSPAPAVEPESNKKPRSKKKIEAIKTDHGKVKATKSKKKEKPPQMTPVEYVRKLQEDEVLQSKLSKKVVVKFLEGKHIFYTGGDMHYASERTRGRMDIIVKYGANLLPSYDASIVTHIITDAQIRPTLRALGLKNLNEIPDHVPTVKWSWVVSGIGRAPMLRGDNEVSMDDVWMHAAFRERFDAGSKSTSKGKGRAQNTDDYSHISEFTQDKPQPRRKSGDTSGINSGDGALSKNNNIRLSSATGEANDALSSISGSNAKKVVDDPLAEFYAQAKAERDDRWSRQGEAQESNAGESDDDIDKPIPGPVTKRGWTCDNKEVTRNTCVNQDIIDKLQELMELHKSKPGDEDHWRAFSYSKCIRALRNHPRRIKSFSEARTIRGIGEKTALKIMEILETGELRRIGYEKTDDVKATRLFQGVYGVGQLTAQKWYASGCRTLEDVTAGKGDIKLTPAQEIGIRFYDDINDRMPRSEAKAIFELIKPIAVAIDPKLVIDIMGSYRRGKADCGDIDIMITRPVDDGKTHAGVLPRLLRDLHAAGIISEDLALPEDPKDLEAIYRGLCRLPHEGARRRRIDFLTIPWTSRGAALLYYTGDDIFNRAIRMKASVLGYTLNQKGLFGGVVRDPRDRRVKLNPGTLVASETEEEIFRVLGVPWQEPHERVRG